MRCPSCDEETPSDAAFCPGCGTRLARVCARCDTPNAPDHNFCKQCGAPLERPLPPSAVPEPAALQGERRHLTVMFCDLVASTALAGRLDPEELSEVLRDYHQTCSAVIRRFDGHVAQYLGDGVLVYFGYPLAHEDDAERAVRAGLEVLAGIGPLNERLHQGRAVRLQVRVGIHSGLVVVGAVQTDSRREALALGETPNLAARLQDLADPDTVVISAATHRLLQSPFAVVDLGPRIVKGRSSPVRLYRVLGERAVREETEPGAPAPTPLVGREEEMDLLVRRWHQVQQGVGQVVLLSGEPGIGKSRLVQAMRERIGNEPYRWLECRGSPYHGNSALYPLIDLLHRALGGDSVGEELLRLEAS